MARPAYDKSPLSRYVQTFAIDYHCSVGSKAQSTDVEVKQIAAFVYLKAFTPRRLGDCDHRGRTPYVIVIVYDETFELIQGLIRGSQVRYAYTKCVHGC